MKRFQRGIQAHNRHTGLWLQIQNRHSDEQIGVATAESHSSHVEVGIWIEPTHWSRGYGHETLAAILPRVTLLFPGKPVTAEADVEHIGSDRLLRSTGFEPTNSGTGRYGNRVRRYTWTEPKTK